MKQPVLPMPALQCTITGPPQLILFTESPSVPITLEKHNEPYHYHKVFQLAS
jgi:hypothetical protein